MKKLITYHCLLLSLMLSYEAFSYDVGMASQDAKTNTFKNSKYKKEYSYLLLPKTSQELFASILKVITQFADEHNIPKEVATEYYERVQEILPKGKDESVKMIAHELWKCDALISSDHPYEFRSIIEKLLRNDFSLSLDTIKVCLAINANLVNRKSIHALAWPLDHKLYHHGILSQEDMEFYSVNKHFRIPAYFSGFYNKSTVIASMDKTSEMPGFRKVLWVIHLNPELRCSHINIINDDQKIAQELLFVPYSVFTVKEIIPGDAVCEIHLLAAYDNKCEPEDLPLAP